MARFTRGSLYLSKFIQTIIAINELICSTFGRTSGDSEIDFRSLGNKLQMQNSVRTQSRVRKTK